MKQSLPSLRQHLSGICLQPRPYSADRPYKFPAVGQAQRSTDQNDEKSSGFDRGGERPQ